MEMVEPLAAWAGAHALEIFLALLVVLLASVYLAWEVIASAYGSFENLVMRFGDVLGVRMNASPRRVLLPVVIMTLSLVPLHLMIDLSEEIAEEESIVRFDENLSAAIQKASRPAAVDAFLVVTFFGNPTVLASTTAGVGLILAFRRRWALLTGWVSSIAGGALGSIQLKALFERARPESMFVHLPGITGWAFPSGHAMNSVIVYGMFAYVASGWSGIRGRKVLILSVTGLVLAIGFSRIYLGVHYLSDVLAGFASGLFWLALCISAFEVLGQGFSSRHSFKGERHGKIPTG